MKLKIGEYDVIESGTVVGNHAEPIDFILDPESELVLRMVFEDDKSTTGTNSKANLFGKNGLQITFTNYNSSLGIGNITPIILGTRFGRELSINYRIYSLEKSGKLVHYTILLGKEVKDGE